MITPDELMNLYPFGLQRDCLGPGTRQTCLLLDLRAGCPQEILDDHQLARWLNKLPCPVVTVLAPGRTFGLTCDLTVTAMADLDAVMATINAAPIASMVFVQLLRLVEQLPLEHALVAESLAYATLQQGSEFKRWLAKRKAIPLMVSPRRSPVLMLRTETHLAISLNRPQNMNAIGMDMRDGLVEAFEMAYLDDSITQVTLNGIGRCFSVGGDLAEFGQNADAAAAHGIRSVRMPGYFLAQCAEKCSAHLHGACIGAGIEIPAFARRVTAARKSFFQLPEIRMGLIPGAGGCVSISRRIGRQKLALWALSARRISTETALSWGLIDAIVES